MDSYSDEFNKNDSEDSDYANNFVNRDSSDKLKVLNSSLKESDSVQKSNRFDAMIKSLVHSSTISRELEKDEETEGYDEDFEDAKAIQKVEDDSGFYQEDFDEEYQDEEFEVVESTPKKNLNAKQPVININQNNRSNSPIKIDDSNDSYFKEIDISKQSSLNKKKNSYVISVEDEEILESSPESPQPILKEDSLIKTPKASISSVIQTPKKSETFNSIHQSSHVSPVTPSSQNKIDPPVPSSDAQILESNVKSIRTGLASLSNKLNSPSPMPIEADSSESLDLHKYMSDGKQPKIEFYVHKANDVEDQEPKDFYVFQSQEKKRTIEEDDKIQTEFTQTETYPAELKQFFITGVQTKDNKLQDESLNTDDLKQAEDKFTQTDGIVKIIDPSEVSEANKINIELEEKSVRERKDVRCK